MSNKPDHLLNEAEQAWRSVAVDTKLCVRFGPFEFYPSSGVLFKQNNPVRIGSRALALLTELAQNAGHFVSIDQLVKAAWPNTIVEETNLRVQIAGLRRLLDDDTSQMSYIANAPGRGYALTVKEIHISESSDMEPAQVIHPLGLMTPLTPLLGRQEVVQKVADKVIKHRCVSIVGPGGIGKTRVASEVSWQIANSSEVMVCFVDLAPLNSGDMVLSTVASTLQLTDSNDIALKDKIIHFLSQRKTLLVFDNCEHVLESVAELTEALLLEIELLYILATSREPLLVNGEITVRLTGLALPLENQTFLSFLDAAQYPAIQLLTERASAYSDTIHFDDQDVPLLVSICRRLDGIPLAIELAAVRVETLGIETLAKLLEDKLTILGGGRRSALPRHQTLTATMSWSFDSLSAQEQYLLVAISVFRSTFSMDAAMAVAQISQDELVISLSNLVAKSLVNVEHEHSGVGYRLLETTRSFSEHKLRVGENETLIRRRHAEYMISIFKELKAKGKLTDGPFDFQQVAADVRTAINWCMGAHGDPKLGIKLIVDSAIMWLRLSILTQYVEIIGDAASRLVEDKLLMSNEGRWLAPMLHYAHFSAVGLSDKVVPMLHNSLRLSKEANDFGCMLNCLWALFGNRLTEAKYTEALHYAKQFAELAPSIQDPVQLAMGHRIVALSLWRNGEFPVAMTLSQSALTAAQQSNMSLISGTFIYKQGVTSRANMTNLLWLMGRVDDARELANQAVAIGLESDVVGLSYALAQTIIPLWFWLGDYESATTQTATLLKLAKENDLGYWHFWGRCYEHALKLLQSDKVPANDLIYNNGEKVSTLHRHILATMLPGFSLHWLSEHNPEPTRTSPHWCSAELQRLQGHEYLSLGDSSKARESFNLALKTSVQQGTLSWELRAATSLAELNIQEGKLSEAKLCLEPVLAKIQQGLASKDVLLAKSTLQRAKLST